MQIPTLKNIFFSLSLLVTCSVPIGLLVACSPTTMPKDSQASTPTTTALSNSEKQPMSHEEMMNNGSGMMNHSMNMDLGLADDNYDLRFIDAMIPHHQGGVTMAKEAQQKSKHPELRKLADEIIKAQNQEITQMKHWRTAWYPKAGDSPISYDTKMGHDTKMSSEQMQSMMMKMDLGTSDREFDLRFIDAMIPHHQGALAMAKDALQKSHRYEIKNLAENIIKSQDAEIKQMKQWRKAWYNK
jgi:uncharacterized protein (DUF305 family)